MKLLPANEPLNTFGVNATYVLALRVCSQFYGGTSKTFTANGFLKNRKKIVFTVAGIL